MGSAPQRTVYSLSDAIVCGQGEGPLRPEPLMLNAVTFSDSSPHADAVHATLLGLDYRRIPLTRESFGQFRWPLVVAGAEPVMAQTDRLLDLDGLAEYAVPAQAPAGWAGHVELSPQQGNRHWASRPDRVNQIGKDRILRPDRAWCHASERSQNPPQSYTALAM